MTLATLSCFPPVSTEDARIVILGSMPGQASLKAQQYYAHPRNGFWPMLASLTGTSENAPYDERIQALLQNRIALWDVLQTCTRDSSLDSDIKDEIPNDFTRFFQEHSHISHVFFNGGKAEQSFFRHVKCCPDHLVYTRLPSTSPANAAQSRAKKQQAWQKIKDILAE